MKRRKNYTSGFKTKVVLEAIQERETIQKIGKKYENKNQIEPSISLCVLDRRLRYIKTKRIEMSTLPTNPSESFKRKNPHLYDGKVEPERAKRIRQDTKPLLNKLETEWGNILKRTHPNVRPQAIKFRLANGTTYCPDFVDLTSRPVTCWEVKGKHAWDDSLVKLKFAASTWPEITWMLVWRENGQWRQQEVLP